LIRDREGDASCGVEDAVPFPKIEPIKPIKQIEPIKAIREIAPIEPVMSTRWGRLPCSIFLALGGKRLNQFSN
jgi:hypothetical protein